MEGFFLHLNWKWPMKKYISSILLVLFFFTFLLLSLKDFSYCKLHLLYAYQPKGKKEDVTDKEEVPEFIEKKIQSA